MIHRAARTTRVDGTDDIAIGVIGVGIVAQIRVGRAGDLSQSIVGFGGGMGAIGQCRTDLVAHDIILMLDGLHMVRSLKRHVVTPR